MTNPSEETARKWTPEVIHEGEALKLLERKKLPETEHGVILSDALEVLARCRPPTDEDGSDTGLVMGYVQSGKTLSYTSVAAMAADNGYPLIIVLSGTTIPLSEQTVDRLYRDLNLGEPGGKIQLFKATTSNPALAQNLNQRLEIWAGPEYPGFPRPTAIVSVMKHYRHIDALTESLKAVNLSGRPCIVIDDEADQHGLNTKVNRGEESSTYESLMRLRDVLPNHTYLQYTATPQANVLISVLDSLSPNFSWVLTPGMAYTGGKAFFLEGDQVINVIPESDSDDPEHELTINDSPPKSLIQAMRFFFIGVAVQASHRAKNEKTQALRSMLIHPSMRQLDHYKYKTWVDRVRQRWVSSLSGTDDEARFAEEANFRSAYEELSRDSSYTSGSETLPAVEDVLEMLLPAIHYTCPAWEVNSRKDAAKWDLNNWSLGPSHILIGGENLGRGFTVEGLTVTYMPRGKGSGYADTIEQRARFFGYKRDYFGLCQVFLDDVVARLYYDYVEHETFLMDILRKLSLEGEQDMAEWRRAMLLAITMKPTRPAVLPRHLYNQLKIDDWTIQSRPHRTSIDSVKSNRQTIAKFVDAFEFNPDEGTAQRSGEQRHLVGRNIPLKQIVDELLASLIHSRYDAPEFSGLELVLSYHLENHPNIPVDVFLMSGASPEVRRQRTLTRDSIQAFQGPSPADGTVYVGDRRVHSNSITLQIHDLDITDKDTGEQWINTPLIAMWLPEGLRKGVLVKRL
jgi:hypothetical protein